VLTLQKADGATTVSISTDDRPLEDLLTKEWLLTNGRGGYASSTIVASNTSGYHGLLIGSLDPPANRIMALANCLEMVISQHRVFNLSTFEFSNKFAPQGFTHLRNFHQDTGVHFDYELDKLQLTKSVYLLRNTDTVVLAYDFKNVPQPVEFVLRPFIGLRDFHSLQNSHALLSCSYRDDGLLVRHDIPNSCELFLKCHATNSVRDSTVHTNTVEKEEISPQDALRRNGVNFEKDQQWWFNFVYRKDRERGQNFTEDLWTPGFFKAQLNSPTKIVLWANLSAHYKPPLPIDTEIDTVSRDLRRHQQNITTVSAKTGNEKLKTLCLAADQFIVTRNRQSATKPTGHETRATILAGYPWFADWGRDAFIALPGLMLATHRFDEAKDVLTTFAAAVDHGMVPNRFDDRTNTACFNSVDASLWFINAAFQYLNTTNDSKTFAQELLPAIRWIIDSYNNGTLFGIHADNDGLITAGNNGTQLTWMDAKYDGVAFTPRCGKPVEINALWYNALCLLSRFYTSRNINNATHYSSMADKAAASFRELFWNDECGYLNDCISPDGSADSTLRPNQIFAVSLPFSALLPQQQKAVVDVVQKNLLTPYGLRTLTPQDSRYKGKYTGPQQQRDEAYHQGTVWPYLLGPFVEAYLKVNEFTRKSKKNAAEFLQPLLQHLTQDACLGSISEIFDGEPPHKPAGCIAQAWSIAELIRAYQLINS